MPSGFNASVPLAGPETIEAVSTSFSGSESLAEKSPVNELPSATAKRSLTATGGSLIGVMFMVTVASLKSPLGSVCR